MKKLIVYTALACLAMASCHKKTATSCSNTITVTDDTGTYTACENRSPSLPSVSTGQIITEGIDVNLSVADSSLELIAASSHEPFIMYISGSKSHIGGPGVYSLPIEDTFQGLPTQNMYKENFSGGQSYSCSGGTINLTHADSTNIAGTFTINLFNAMGSKVVTGFFNANQPHYY